MGSSTNIMAASTHTMNDRDIEYCRLRATGQSPMNAYRGAEFSLQTGALKVNIEKKEKKPTIIAKIAEFKSALLKEGNTGTRAMTKVQADAVHKEVMARPSARKMDKGEIEQRLTDLHARAEEVGDLQTARQILVDLGRDKGMFTPVQKIRVEKFEDLTLEEVQTMLRVMMQAKQEEDAVVSEPQPSEEQPIVQ